jgi:tetratricopeptide (TPR) repeat protein
MKPLLIGAGIALVLAGIFLYWQKSAFLVFLNPSAGGNATSTIDLGNGVSVPTNGEGIAVLPIENPNAVAPALDRKVSIPSSIPDDAAVILKQKLEEDNASLKANPEQLLVWLQYGIYLKIAGDYDGARGAWEYVAAAAPSNYVAFFNLGELYMGIIKDYPKAEADFKKVIELKPSLIDGYRDLYTLYHYAYKVGTGADAAILEQGLKANPGNQDLLTLQAQLKAGK